MATDNARQPIPAAKRKRLQACFEHGSRSSAQGNFDYAADMFTQCVIGDPSNIMYTQQFLWNLQKKYNNNKKGAKFASIKGAGPKGWVQKASMSKDWLAVIKSGLEMLKLNPWDVPTLTAMATACQELQLDECQLAYLKSALDANPKDVNVNRLCGRALARMAQFDQSVACWQRVAQAKPGDEEAMRAMANLAIEKTISHGGYDQAESSTDVMSDKEAQSERYGNTAALSREQQLEKLIGKNPAEQNHYLELAELHSQNERYAEAEKVLAKALEVSGGAMHVLELLEDTQIRRRRQQWAIAEKLAAQDKTEESKALAKRMEADLNRVEIDVYRSRSERTPANVGLKFELGVRLKRAGNFNEAIRYLQEARGDGKRRAAVHLELGECFQYVKQYKLAIDMYEQSLAASERDADSRKLALYRAGVLAMAIAERDGDAYNFDKADRYLNEVAAMDFNYKDVPQRLDKLAKIRNKG